MVTTKVNLSKCGATNHPSILSCTAQTPIVEYMALLAEQLVAANRFGTANNYRKTIRSLERFLGGESAPLAAINEEFVGDYNVYLVQRGIVRNSRSFYMRILRAVYNRAVRQKLLAQTYPFVEVYTGVDGTRKRAVGEEVIRSLRNLPLRHGTPHALARDLFLFSYCTRGMAFVDIAYLRWDNLLGDMLYYSRHKTGQQLSVRVEPCIKRILDSYANPRSPYLFPILTSTDVATAYEEYVCALNTHNRLLGELSKMVDCGCRLTSYTPRHSWATAARHHNVPLSIISAGMGHSSEQTTRIYLSQLDNSIIDDANLSILKALE